MMNASGNTFIIRFGQTVRYEPTPYGRSLTAVARRSQPGSPGRQVAMICSMGSSLGRNRRSQAYSTGPSEIIG